MKKNTEIKPSQATNILYVIGLDLGAKTGLCVMELDLDKGDSKISKGYPPKLIDSSSRKFALPDRLSIIEKTLTVAFEEIQPYAVAIERPIVTFGRISGNIPILQMHGVATLVWYKITGGGLYEIPIGIIKKSITGVGNAKKDLMKRHVTKLYPIINSYDNITHDVIDATAVAHVACKEIYTQWRKNEEENTGGI